MDFPGMRLLHDGGIVLLCLGILGQYLAKTYTEVKKRPIYIARERSIKPFN